MSKIDSENKTKKADARTRVFETIIYPCEEEYNEYYEQHCEYIDKHTGEVKTIEKYDGADGWGDPKFKNWRGEIEEMCIAALVSPMHIGDVNADGTIKKPHRHVMFIFESKKNYETQVKPLFDRIGGVGRIEVYSTAGSARYLIHMDNPEKFQYNMKDVLEFGGADYRAIIQAERPGDKMKALHAIEDFIKANDIRGYAELLDTLRINNPDLETYAAMSLTYVIKEYLKSRTWQDSFAAKKEKLDKKGRD